MKYRDSMNYQKSFRITQKGLIHIEDVQRRIQDSRTHLRRRAKQKLVTAIPKCSTLDVSGSPGHASDTCSEMKTLPQKWLRKTNYIWKQNNVDRFFD